MCGLGFCMAAASLGGLRLFEAAKTSLKRRLLHLYPSSAQNSPSERL